MPRSGCASSMIINALYNKEAKYKTIYHLHLILSVKHVRFDTNPLQVRTKFVAVFIRHRTTSLIIIGDGQMQTTSQIRGTLDSLQVPPRGI